MQIDSRVSKIIEYMRHDGTRRSPPLRGLQWMCEWEGLLAFQSKLDLDTDGCASPDLGEDATHQGATSMDPSGRIIDSNTMPYFVLPGGFAAQYGIQLGDIACVTYRDSQEFAIYADSGPRGKIGEGSIALHRSLGFERVHDGRIIDCGIDTGVVTLVFPGSGAGIQAPEYTRGVGSALIARYAARISA